MTTYGFRDLYFERPEPTVQETASHRCTICSNISYDKFRSSDPASELLESKTVIIGSYAYITTSAFAGCWVCRLLLRQISQIPTSLRATDSLYDIAAVGLRLSLDDELTIHCFDQMGYDVQLHDLSSLFIKLEDGEWSETFKPEDAMFEKMELQYGPVEGSQQTELMDHNSNRLILNPDVSEGPRFVRSWLSTCHRTHMTCHVRSECPILPTRILDVGESGDIARSRLIITDGYRDEYVTLSHCWGRPQHTMSLTKENMASLMEGISDDDMPRTFREAVMMVRGIGLQYLWIDSMCIIQPTSEDNSDWEIEGAKMGSIYRNSTFTIAASSAADNTEGCLFGKAASQFDVHPVSLFDKPINRNWDGLSEMVGRNSEWFPMMVPQPASWLNHVQNAPLNSRAWVLQERMLSPRILHCTMAGFFWECSELRASEYEPIGCKFDYHFRDQGLLNTNKLLNEQHEMILGKHWRRIVERYCQLGISVSSDRLPALAGLANIIQDHTEDTYIAGHWKGSLVSSLLWFRLDEDQGKSKYQRNPAPSWSWASTSGQIRFASLDESDYPARDPKNYRLVAEVVGLDFTPLKQSPFNWVSSSRLTIHGHFLDADFPRRVELVPGFEIMSKLSSESWLGYKPTESCIPQLAGICISKTPYFVTLTSNDGDAPSWDKSLPCEDTEDPEEPISTKPIQQQVPESSKGFITLNHGQLGASLKEQTERSGTSGDPNAHLEAEQVQTLGVVFDDPNDATPHAKIGLLELLRSETSEGLLLISTTAGEYRRIGYFKTKIANLFESVPEVELVIS